MGEFETFLSIRRMLYSILVLITCVQSGCSEMIPQSCKELRQAHPQLPNGEYWIQHRQISGYQNGSYIYNEVMIKTYCYRMNMCSPREYVTLMAPPGENFAYSEPKRNVTRGIPSPCGDPPDYTIFKYWGRTDFHKVWIGKPLQILIGGFAFSNTTGPKMQAYAMAGACYSRGPDRAKGRFQIDLRGTGLAISNYAKWKVVGSEPLVQNVRMTSERQEYSLNCGGMSAICYPKTPLWLNASISEVESGDARNITIPKVDGTLKYTFRSAATNPTNVTLTPEQTRDWMSCARKCTRSTSCHVFYVHERECHMECDDRVTSPNGLKYLKFSSIEL